MLLMEVGNNPRLTSLISEVFQLYPPSFLLHLSGNTAVLELFLHLDSKGNAGPIMNGFLYR